MKPLLFYWTCTGTFKYSVVTKLQILTTVNRKDLEVVLGQLGCIVPLELINQTCMRDNSRIQEPCFSHQVREDNLCQLRKTYSEIQA